SAVALTPDPPKDIPARPASPEQKAPEGVARPGVDRHGDPLPPGAVVRLGTTRFRTAGRIDALTFSPDGQTLAAGPEAPIYRWPTATGRELPPLRGFAQWSRSLVFTDGGKSLLAAHRENTLVLWDLATGKELRHFKGHEAMVGGFSLSPDGKSVVTSGGDGTVRLWNVATGEQLWLQKGLPSRVDAVFFSDRGKVVGVCCDGREVRVLRADTGKEVRRFS